VRGIVDRAPGLAETGGGEHIDEVIFGDANGAGEENRNIARMATLLAGLPTGVPAFDPPALAGLEVPARPPRLHDLERPT